MFSRGDKLENGHYTIIKEIGVGGMGVVYHCRDEQLMRDVAVKMLLPDLMADKANLEVFLQEARLAAQLEHPNVVTVYDIGVEDRNRNAHHYVCMEYLPGGNLANRVISGPLAVEHCLNWMKQLASGLTYAHKRGVVHQDIKADNIFITTEGDLKIGDFGLARLLVGRVHYNAQTKGMGTPAYMSPELCRGESQDYRSDIYSLGVLFFEMATGQLPFRARGMIEMATKHSSAPVPSAKRINPLVPEILDKVVRRMMAKTPEERYSSMSEVLTILDDLIFELRVARLGLGNRPLMRSGNVQAELMSHGHLPAHSSAPSHQTPPVHQPVQLDRSSATESEENARRMGRVRSSAMTPDTEPQTTSLPPVDPSVARNLSDADSKLKGRQLSPSEKLIAQLESDVGRSAGSDGGNSSSADDSALRSTPRSRGAGHFVNTQQIGGRTDSGSVIEPTPDVVHSSFEQIAGKTIAIELPDPRDSQAPVSATTSTTSGSTAAQAAHPTAFSGSGSAGTFTRAPGEPGSQQAKGTASGSGFAGGSNSTPPKSNPPQSKASSPSTGMTTSRQTGGSPTSFGAPRLFQSPSSTGNKLPKMRQGPILKNLKTGLDLRWTFKTHGPIGWTSAPVIDKEERFLYVCSADGHLYCLDALSGVMRWSCSIGAPMLASPIVSGDKILVVCSVGLICAVSAHDGSVMWRFDARDTLVATPCLYKDLLVVPSLSGKLLAVESSGGLQRWQYKAESGIVSTPHAHGSLLMFGTKGGDFHAISADGGKRVWRFVVGAPVTASPAASVDSVYFGSEGGTFFAVEAESGRLIWEYSTEKPIISKAAISFTSVLFCSHDRWLYSCERYDGGLSWKGALKGRVVASLVATRDTALTVTREGWVQAFAIANGECRWQKDLGRSLESPPLITSDHLYIGTVEGEVIAYSFLSAGVLSEKSA